MKLLLLVVTVAFFNSCNCSRILCLMPLPSRSHTIVVQKICQELASRNHDITAITSFPIENPPSNYKQIDMYNVLEYQKKNQDAIDFMQFIKYPTALLVPIFYYMGSETIPVFFENEKLVEFLNSDEKFDLVFSESFIDEGLFAGFAQRFQTPIVLVHPFMPNLWSENMVGNPAPFAYIPDPFLMYGTRMSFCERVINVVYGILHRILYHYWYIPTQDSIMRQYFGKDLAPLSDIIQNVSLVLVNHHHSLGFPRPYVPNMVEVGGMQVAEPKKLPQDLQEYLDKATEGVIYFSFGSNLETSKLPDDTLKIFIEVFSKLKQKVLFKWEKEELPGKPDNVKTSKWFPQSDVLAHPNLKLFITHGGLGSIIETVHRGVPIVGIPLFAEQPLNMKHAVAAGIGKMINFFEMSTENLYEAVIEVLENPKYQENVEYRSALLKDAPDTPMERAVYWIEYVLRHKGAYHLRSAGQDLHWLQLYLVDVLLVIAGAILIAAWLTLFVVRKCTRRFCSKKNVQVSKSKKEK